MDRKILIASALVVAFFLGVTVTFGLMSYSRRIESEAELKGVGISIYAYANKSSPVSAIKWGLMEPGESRVFDCFVFNEGNSPLTLSMVVENWVPENASGQMSLTWTYAGEQLDVRGYIPVVFVLTLNPSISGLDSFGFTIVVTGSG